MTSNSDPAQSDLIANARQNMVTAEQTTRNPFKLGMQNAKEQWKIEYAAAVASGQFQKPVGAQGHSWGWKAVGALVLVGLFVKFAPSTSENDMSFAERANRAESRAEFDCDAEAKRRVKNPSSYDSDWAGTKLIGAEWWVQANFRAINGFGAMLDSHFVCRYDIDLKKVVAIELFEGAK